MFSWCRQICSFLEVHTCFLGRARDSFHNMQRLVSSSWPPLYIILSTLNPSFCSISCHFYFSICFMTFDLIYLCTSQCCSTSTTTADGIFSPISIDSAQIDNLVSLSNDVGQSLISAPRQLVQIIWYPYSKRHWPSAGHGALRGGLYGIQTHTKI